MPDKVTNLICQFKEWHLLFDKTAGENVVLINPLKPSG
jgi:hypothetical protein